MLHSYSYRLAGSTTLVVPFETFDPIQAQTRNEQGDRDEGGGGRGRKLRPD